MKKTETDAVRAKAAAMHALVKIRNDVAMRDHDSFGGGEVSVYEINEVHFTDL